MLKLSLDGCLGIVRVEIQTNLVSVSLLRIFSLYVLQLQVQQMPSYAILDSFLLLEGSIEQH
jgi:hypothetical protein